MSRVLPRVPRTAWMGLLLASAPAATLAQEAELAAASRLAVVLPRAAEERLALSAAPVHLRGEATVYVYGDAGYERIRTGTNGFTCLVNRDGFFYGAGQLKPTCWDAEGAGTYVPVMLEVGRMLASGASPAATREAVADGFRAGTFRAPRTGGVAFMLAGDVDVDPASGEVVTRAFPGHYMFYAVGATSDQLGFDRNAARSDPTLPSVFAGGAGGEQGLAYIIVVPEHPPASPTR